MAIFVIKLSKKQRKILYLTLIVLSSAQIAIASGIIILALHVYFGVGPTLYSERSEISFVFFQIGISATFIILLAVMGIKIARKCIKQPQKISTRSLVFLWSCLSFYISIYLIILSHLLRKVNKHIIRSMKHSLKIGMVNYLKMESWKVTIDKIQSEMQCCGIIDYKDWHETMWLNKYVINTKSEKVQSLRDSENHWLYPVTPWSCCKIDVSLQCLHDPLQQVQWRHIWRDDPNLISESLNANGCLSVLRVPIENALTIFITFVIFNFLLQLIAFLVGRYLYTSCRNASIMYDNLEGVAPGWLFGRGDFGYNGGKTIAQIMEETSEKPTKKNKQLYRNNEFNQSVEEVRRERKTAPDYVNDETPSSTP